MKWLPVFYFLILGIIPHTNNVFMEQTDKNILLGKFDPSVQPDFEKVSSPHTYKDGIYLQKDTYEAFKQMHEAARKEGINLVIISATRTFNRQKQIWENKWNGKTRVGGKNLKTAIPDPVERAITILTYSSMPGTSRHHWGTDIDINSVTPSYFKSGKGLKEYQWLMENAQSFGFCQPYQEKGIRRQTGYEDEPWHWSYTPLSCKYLKDYMQTVTYEDIQGFHGAETAKEAEVIKHYVLGIDNECLCEEK